MDKHVRDLRHCLASLRVRAWRLHLDTPGVRATVPMLGLLAYDASQDLSFPPVPGTLECVSGGVECVERNTYQRQTSPPPHVPKSP
jgi:hypothetical protein